MNAPPNITDARRMAGTRESVRLNNEAKVYKALQTLGRPASVTEIHTIVTDVVEKTIRRAITGLKQSGFVIEAGRHSGTYYYALADQQYESDHNQGIVPVGKQLVTIKNFLKLFTSEVSSPLNSQLKAPVMTDEMARLIRRIMLSAILTSGDPGYTLAMEKQHERLMKIQSELERLLDIVRSFNDSPVWYDQYRDRMALALREVQKEDAELVQLAFDYMRSERSE